ncbi:MAG: elongation factor 1-beta [Candidatus Aenigmarchaeota archaeon]|nr:elongation factor 1-beta [Candidatus Aenigmarchaeota archaeon]MDW8149448.1 elongation factor 1-beta [Candidatus Aenigmarchaeota archaeon]
MSKIIVILKVFPTENANINNIKEKIEILVKPEKIEIEDFVFGLKCLVVHKIIEDVGNILEELENKIKSIDGVSSVEVERITRSI